MSDPPIASPGTMKCVHASALGDISEVLTVTPDAPRPVRDVKDVKNGKTMLVRVEACSLSPGDTVMLSGACDKVMQPPSFPFVPGMDVCGIVEEISEGSDKFKVGDRIIATNGYLPVGGLAECASVELQFAAKAPENVTACEASALPNSPVAALDALRAGRVKEGDRVLVVGGSGGVGSSLLQLAKDAKAGYIATTSTDEALCLSLGADRVIDYRKTDWCEEEEYKASPFDVVIDCVGWRDEWKEAYKRGVLKSAWSGGTFVSIASTDDPQFHTIWQGVTMFVPLLWRAGWTRINRRRPFYSLVISSVTEKSLREVADLVSTGRLKAVIDHRSPFPLTAEGVKAAFQLQASKHAHGKVVISVLDADRSADGSAAAK